MRSIFRFLTPYILYSVMGLSLVSCENDLQDIAKLQMQSQAGVEQAEDIVIYYSDSAVVRMRVKAPLMLYYLDPKNPRREFPKGLEAEFFDPNQQISSRLSAKYAEQLDNSQKITMRDSVVIWNNKQERLETQELICEERSQLIRTDKFVKIQTPTYTMFGYGLVYNLETTNWTLNKVSGNIISNSNGDNPLQ